MKRLSIMGLGAIAVAALGLYPAVTQAQSLTSQAPAHVSSSGFFEPADVPIKAGTFEASLSIIGVIPETFSSSISPIGGQVNASGGVSPELTGTYFLTNHWALQLIAASTHHRISAGDTSLGHVDVGNAWVLPPTLTVQYHFLPDDRFSPYVGVGVTVAFFYATDPSAPVINKFSLDTTAARRSTSALITTSPATGSQILTRNRCSLTPRPISTVPWVRSRPRQPSTPQ